MSILRCERCRTKPGISRCLLLDEDKNNHASKQLGSVSLLDEVQKLADNFQGVDKLVASLEKDLVTMAMVNLRGLQAIYADIQAESYKQLLTTAKYY